MMQAHNSDPHTPAEHKGWISRLDQAARNPRFLGIALGFAALNAAAAVAVLTFAPAPQAPVSTAVPAVTVARLAPVSPGHRIIVEDVVRRLPRAQTWHPPHLLPSGGRAAAAPDLPRIAPVALKMPGTDSAPLADIAPAPEALAAALPGAATSQPDPQVQLASLMPQDILTPAPLRPRARPDLPDLPDTALAPDLNEINQLAVSLRPQARPKDLYVPQPQIATAPEPTQDDVTTLAALPRAIERPVSGATCNSRLTRAIPKRRGSARGGKAVMAALMGAGGTTRDQAVAQEILSGNTPSFLQDLVPVEVSGRARDGSRNSIVFCVMPDYLAVGSDRDFVRVPLGLPAATQIASRFDMMLPTRQMVDQIYRAADVRVTPKPMKPGPQMSSTDYLLRHNATVEGQIRGASVAGRLASGHKKDLVLTNRLNSNRGRVAIYGWHRSNGKAIQPLSTVHGKNYADYSHGIRLISQTAYLNGRPVRLADLFADPTYAALISDEGPIRAAQLQLASAN